MEGDTSASAAAQRKKLQEELAAAQEEYDEALYDRNIETQQQSLDKSLETYRAEQEAKMEELDAWLEQEETVIAESYNVISANTEAIHSNIEAISDKYGVEIEHNVVDPWTAGITALGTYGTELDTSTSKYVEMLSRVRQELVDLQLAADSTAASIINATNQTAKKTEAAVKDVPKPSTNSNNNSSNKPSSGGHSSYGSGGPSSSNISTGQIVIVNADATHFARDGGNGGTKMHSWVPGSTFTVMETSGDQVLIGIPGVGYTGWVYKDDISVISGASGSTSGTSSSKTSNKTSSSTSKTSSSTSKTSSSTSSSASKTSSSTSSGYQGALVVGDEDEFSRRTVGTTEYRGGLALADEDEFSRRHYAKGTTGVKNDELAWIDENGLEELVMHAEGGRLTYLTKGSSVIPHDITENLMELGKVDPKTWLEKNRKTSVPASFVTNNNTIDLQFGSLINIEHADRDSIPEIQDAVRKQMDSYMKNINANLKKFTR